MGSGLTTGEEMEQVHSTLSRLGITTRHNSSARKHCGPVTFTGIIFYWKWIFLAVLYTALIILHWTHLRCKELLISIQSIAL